jgi:hypothetical protein
MAGERTDLRVACLLATAALAAAFPPPAARAAETTAAKPPAEGPPAPAVETALVLPTRVPQAQAAARAPLDLLIATALQELGLAVVSAGQATKRLDAPAADLAEARELYIDLKYDEALAAARAVRAAYLALGGDLLGDPTLTEAELLIVRILLDRGEQAAARELAMGVLEREPGLRLDPVDYPPAMQALWIAALDRMAAMQPQEQPVDALAALARAIGVGCVVAATVKRTPDGIDWLVIQIVPSAEAERPSRHPTVLGENRTWARSVRLKLEERFPPPPPAIAATPVVPVVPAGPTDDGKKKVWYKSWWLWGPVLVLAVAGGAVGLAIGLDEDETGAITADGF